MVAPKPGRSEPIRVSSRPAVAVLNASSAQSSTTPPEREIGTKGAPQTGRSIGQTPEETLNVPEMPLRSICGKRLSHSPAKWCNRYPAPGARYCSAHGGRVMALPPGDPRKGGRPITHGMYSKYLKNKVLADYNAAEVGTLEYDVKVAKAKLAWALRKWQDDPDGGIPVASGKEGEQRVHLWSDIVETHQRTVLQLERGHHEITAAQPVPAALQVNIQVVQALSGLPAEAQLAYAETGELPMEAWETPRKVEGK